ncbi:MAG: UDP-N-acetylmuramate--L-alanine ligase [Acidimicrobiia bacterium]
MNLPYQRIHIVGAGGAGMSALAKILLADGLEVSGSDLRGGASLQSLADLGIEVFTGHRPDIAVQADLVVASSAVPEYDEELTAATRAGVEVWRRPQLLSAISAGISTVGATGTHGKTTTTALMISALRAADVDPWFVIGGEMTGMGTNGHKGSTDLLVLEADEAFRTFESIHFNGLIITNIEAEHLEHFGTESDLLESFVGVATAVDGPVVSCLDDEGAATLASRLGTITYGKSAGADWVISDVEHAEGGVSFTLRGGAGSTQVRLGLPGNHVVSNAAGALALLAEMGYPLDALADGVSEFRGVGRRWEHRGTVSGVTLIDDYAHHPTEVTATLEAARAVAPGKVWAVFQPHLYSRTERFSEEFGHALAKADEVVVTDVYGARETPVPGITGELVADAAERSGAATHYVPHRAELADTLVPMLRDGDFVITMGAGDITLLPAELAQRLAKANEQR